MTVDISQCGEQTSFYVMEALLSHQPIFSHSNARTLFGPLAMAEDAAHSAGIAGADRVGLGLDFMFLEGSDYGFFHAARARWPRGYPDPPWSFQQPESLGDLVVALEAKGFSQSELKGILGDNYLRLAIREDQRSESA